MLADRLFRYVSDGDSFFGHRLHLDIVWEIYVFTGNGIQIKAICKHVIPAWGEPTSLVSSSSRRALLFHSSQSINYQTTVFPKLCLSFRWTDLARFNALDQGHRFGE